MSEPRRGMGRFRRTLGPVAAALGLSCGLVVLSAVGAAGSSDPSVETACSGTLSGSTFTLTADCDTTVPLTIPDGVTLNGAGFTMTAHDVTPASFDGAVLSNAGTSMNVEDLTIMGTGFTMPPGVCSRTTLNGIFFNGAGGSVTNVTVTGITENSNCQVGRAIVANGTAGQTLTITGTTVSDYNKNGIQASGMTMNVSGSVIGPPASLPPRTTGQNGLVYLDGATGTTSGSAIYGSGYGGVRERKRGCAPVRGDKRHLDGRHDHGRRNRHRRGRGPRQHRTTQHRRDRRPKSDRPDRPRRARHFRLRSGVGPRVDGDGDLQHLQRLEDRLVRSAAATTLHHDH